MSGYHTDCEDEYEPIAQVADKIPFSRVIEAPVRAGMEADVCAMVEECNIQIETNQQGEYRILTCECLINAWRKRLQPEERQSYHGRIFNAERAGSCAKGD